MNAEPVILSIQDTIPFRKRERMTRDQAQRCRDEIKKYMQEEGRCKILSRARLLDLHECEGWRLLGYSSHLECAMVEFSINNRQRYDQLLDAAKVDRNLREQAEIKSTQADTNSGESSKTASKIFDVRIPESQACALSSVVPERQLDVLEDASKDGKATAKKIAASAERMGCKVQVNKKERGTPRDDEGARALRRIKAMEKAIGLIQQAQDALNGVEEAYWARKLAAVVAEIRGAI